MTAPFGIELYSPIENFEISSELGQGKFIVKAPKPHPAFEKYVIQATPSLGVIWIKGLSPLLTDDAFGGRSRQSIDELKAQLSKRYGRGETSDFLLSGSIWAEERDWSQALSVNERHYFTIWERGSAQVPDDLKSIFLGAIGFSSDDTGYFIEYYSSKYDEAELELQATLSDLL